jgi:hypothetical protein
MDMSKPYSIEKLDALPEGARVKTGVYEDMITDIIAKGQGVYSVTIDRKPQTIFQALYKRTKDNEKLKLHKIQDKVYVEVLVAGVAKPLGKKK